MIATTKTAATEDAPAITAVITVADASIALRAGVSAVVVVAVADTELAVVSVDERLVNCVSVCVAEILVLTAQQGVTTVADEADCVAVFDWGGVELEVWLGVDDEDGVREID